MKKYIRGANPYMPLWEHVPDGEPRVFEHEGKKRVYVYGSHDIAKTQYCGRNYVVWSAPVEDLTDWTCHGVSYETHYDSVLYAPDVVKRGDTYYLYAAERKGSLIVVASAKTPWGPLKTRWRQSWALIRASWWMMMDAYTPTGAAARRPAISRSWRRIWRPSGMARWWPIPWVIPAPCGNRGIMSISR